MLFFYFYFYFASIPPRYITAMFVQRRGFLAHLINIIKSDGILLPIVHDFGLSFINVSHYSALSHFFELTGI